MATFEFNGKTIYIDGILQKKIDNEIIQELKAKDMDVVFAICGRERSGKSTLAQSVGGYIASRLGTNFDLSNICMSPNELRERIENAKQNEVIIYDEAHRGMASARSLSEINTILRNLFMEMGQLNLCVIVVLPSFFMLDKYQALHRCRGLFFVYMKGSQRGFWVYFNEKAKRELYIKGKKYMNMDCIKWPDLRGRFYIKTPIPDTEYRAKKKKSFQDVERITRQDNFQFQRDTLIKELKENCGYTFLEIENAFKRNGAELKERECCYIYNKLVKEYGKKGKSEGQS